MPQTPALAHLRLPLFVFGTLRRGQCNHHLLQDRYARCLPAELPDYTRVEELMIDRQPGGVVQGELFTLSPEVYEQTLADCDELEEIPLGELIGHEYERRQVAVQVTGGSGLAWAYVRPDR